VREPRLGDCRRTLVLRSERPACARDIAAAASTSATPSASARSIVTDLVRLLLNVIWFVLCGLWMALGYLVAAVFAFLLIVTIPFGIAALRIALFALWPFGRTVVKRPGAGAASALGNVVWLVLFGWWLALGHIITGVLLCLTVIGIPLGLANFKLVPVSLLPLGRDVVSIEQARQLGLRIDTAVPHNPRSAV
jgi:uncharacterized membrane protein YccF (DUF307 family)